MKKTKKLLVLLLTMAVITTMMPGTAFAEEQKPEITSVELTGFTFPVGGANPDFELSVPEGAHYHLAARSELLAFYDYPDKNVGGLWWVKARDIGRHESDYQTPSDQFVENINYLAAIVVVPDEGYAFSQQVKVTINGKSDIIDRIQVFGVLDECNIQTVPLTAAKPKAEGLALDSTNFPDANFMEYVKGFDQDKDDILTKEEIASVKHISYEGTDMAEDKKIKSFEGIKHFTEVENIYCPGNKVEKLDLSGLTKLKKLQCYGSGIKELNLKGCTALERLYCSNNLLSNLDLSTNSKLDALVCSNNNLNELDISKNTGLRIVNAQCNNITTVNTDANPLLRKIYHAPKKIKMNVRENFDYTTVPTLDEFLLYCMNADEDSVKVQTDGIIFNPEKKTVSLEKGRDSGRLILIGEYDEEVICEHTFYYEKDVPKAEVNEVKTEVKKTATPETVAPKTGDKNMPGIWLTILAVAGTSVILIFRRKKVNQ